MEKIVRLKEFREFA